ncbi:MAG: adenylosuccinate lyase [Candidatus Ancillula sp.]|jgi:adenylosuccinate lyase|nr:adenylosuccinate lyase [Candidatus Ancillula sp.]
MRKNLEVPISPVDGRYKSYTAVLANYLSEAALNRERIYVEIEWLIALCDGLPVSGFDNSREPMVPGLTHLSEEQKDALRNIVAEFDGTSIERLSAIEEVTKHDVKAVEYYIKEELDKLRQNGVLSAQEYDKLFQGVHIFCTSEDVNNLSYALCIKNAVQEVWLPRVEEFLAALEGVALTHIDTPMLAKTHGQPATPVTLGKELAVFAIRLRRQIYKIRDAEYLGKINGATGTFGAHFVSVPTAKWPDFAKFFVEERLKLSYNPLTTQIESHDWQAELYDRVKHVGRILHNLATDFWIYISNEVFIQIPDPKATGSSTMPHKVNPIKFENAEANLEISDALFSKLSETLVTSRMQRDLTDSTTQRNVSVAFGHSLIALGNLTSGIKALKVNDEHLLAELDDNTAVLGEAVQSVMRAASIGGVEGMENPYERLKALTRGNQEITKSSMTKFIEDLELPEPFNTRLLELTPAKYTGLSSEIARQSLQ